MTTNDDEDVLTRCVDGRDAKLETTRRPAGILPPGAPERLFYRFLYRRLMELAHRFNWHYAPEFGPIAPDGTYQRWCHWCGLRQSYRKTRPGEILKENAIRHTLDTTGNG